MARKNSEALPGDRTNGAKRGSEINVTIPEQEPRSESKVRDLAADLAIGFIASGQEKKSEEQDLAPNKKRGPRL